MTRILEFFPNFPVDAGISPGDWAASMEARGWHGVCASDHLWVGHSYPHVFVAATQMACATNKVMVTTSFCNNLFRSPVEFAQAALSLQAASNGRFEAGLGAGWAADEIQAMGKSFPDAPIRVSMYVEALTIVRDLLRTGQCEFQGEYYQVNISGENRLAGVTDQPPPLVASAGGPRAIREVTPLVDRLEIKASARATRVGHLDFGILASVTEQEVHARIQRARELRPELPLGIFLLLGAGDNAQVKQMQSALGDSYLAQFFGEPAAVADALRGLAEQGIGRVQLTELVPGTLDALAGELL